MIINLSDVTVDSWSPHSFHGNPLFTLTKQVTNAFHIPVADFDYQNKRFEMRIDH